MKIRMTDRDGFSLVELMISMVMISVGLLAMSNLFLASIEHSKQGRHDMAALNTANEILERIHAVPYDEAFDLFNGVDTTVPASIPVEARNWAAHVYDELGPTGSIRVNFYRKADKVSITSNGIMEVEVLARWTERGRPRTMKTSTYLVRMGS